MANTSASPGTHVAAHLLSLAHPPTTVSRIFTEKVKLRPLHLKPGENPTPSGRAYRRTLRLQAASKLKKKRKPQPLSAAEKRATGLHSIPSDQQKYAIFEPLHQLWIGYINEILGSGRPISGPVAAKLASADYHGALLQVARSRCTSRVGVKGIVVKDTKFTFEIITEEDELKVLPKEHTVFRFEVRDDTEAEESKDTQPDQAAKKSLIFELHGDQFQHRAVDRANKKFKQHFLPDL
ncbi:hypothetical protein V500_10845 [Pseudogymnoascus sp. VKM F-4518 (FW-2643)]|nr:hypothetical protein V500_10845 [Pseudogymnoascus sp. VKM F-4518 (FW-2643)]